MIPFKIVTPYGVTYEDSIDKVTIPTGAGEITVLENHAPLVSTIVPGEVFVHKDGHVVGLRFLEESLRYVRVGKYICLHRPQSGQNSLTSIDEEAKRRAEELLKEQEQALDVDFARIQALIERETARISVGRRYRGLK